MVDEDVFLTRLSDNERDIYDRRIAAVPAANPLDDDSVRERAAKISIINREFASKIAAPKEAKNKRLKELSDPLF